MRLLKQLADMFRPRRTRSDFTLLEGSDGSKALVDPKTLVYLQTAAPQPTQAALDSLLNRVHAVRVFENSCHEDALIFNSELLMEVSNAKDLAELRRALTIADGPNGHCMCYGGPTLEMLSLDGSRLALLGIHHGLAIRWSQWKDDARLTDGRMLLERKPGSASWRCLHGTAVGSAPGPDIRIGRDSRNASS